MIKFNFILPAVVTMNLLLVPLQIQAATNSEHNNENSAVGERIIREKVGHTNPFVISTHRLTYLLPFYYSPKHHDPSFEHELKHAEVKYQFSFKIPIWAQILNSDSDLFLAYTQQSHWQAYSDSPSFRTTDYEPEIFLANHIKVPLPLGWQAYSLNVGGMHQSNGEGGIYERSWNRVYAEPIFAKGDWVLGIKPWYIIPDHSKTKHNNNIARFLGYEQAFLGYKFHSNVISFTARNTVESKFRRASMQVDWTFPLLPHLFGYVQFFSGYGQSLVEYNHYVNAVGVGFAVNSWL